MTIQVPSNYVPLLQQMAKATGIPYNVEAAQANDESGFDANAVSSAGAQGWLQFLPSTYNAYVSQAGVAQGTEFNPGDETRVYDVYMKQLLAQFGGNVQDALAAYNAGPDNIQAGMGYATSILEAAGQPVNTTAGPTAGSGAASSGGTSDFLPSWLQRILLVIFGATVLIIGIIHMSGSGSGQSQPKSSGAGNTESGRDESDERNASDEQETADIA
jgi:hypothetical protein